MTGESKPFVGLEGGSPGSRRGPMKTKDGQKASKAVPAGRAKESTGGPAEGDEDGSKGNCAKQTIRRDGETLHERLRMGLGEMT